MTDTTERERLRALEKLREAVGAYLGRAPADNATFRAMRRAYEAVPPKPVELIKIEGWGAIVEGFLKKDRVVFRSPGCETVIYGPERDSPEEAKAAANAMLLDIAAKVQKVQS